MKNTLIIATSILILGCKDKEPRIVYNDDKAVVQELINDSTDNTKKLIADLPFSFDSLDFLYFPIGETDESFKMNLRNFGGSYSGDSRSYSLGYISGRKINFNLDNILIRPKDKSGFYLLTDKVLKIKSLTYLYQIDTLYNKDRFVYRIIDSDSNKDGVLDDDDLVGLYSSSTDGSNFKRISPANQQLIDWETQSDLGLLYFRTMVDIDKNGLFDENDRINLYEYDLIKEDKAVLIFNEKLYSDLI